ncbi:MAG: hypothetical protein AAGA48_03655 [Myxococcota bacterium]
MLPLVLSFVAWFGCAVEPEPEPESPEPTSVGYALGSVVITPDARTTYVQVLPDLDPRMPITNAGAIESPGNGVLMSYGSDVFIGQPDSPVWVRYTADDNGAFTETGRISLANQGLRRVEFGNTIIDDELALTISAETFTAVVWNHRSMTIERSIDMSHMRRNNLILENFSTSAHEGLVYIPARWGNVLTATVYHAVSMTIVDPRAGEIVAIAEDDRCASGGRIVFDADGYGYVMGDGRNLSAQVAAKGGGAPAAPTCLLRIPPGGTEFDPDWHVEIPSLTGGLNAATELEFAEQGTGVGYTWMFHPEMLPKDFEIVDFEFWTYPVFELWQIELSETPSAKPVANVPFGILGFQGASVDGKLYVGVGDTAQSTVYEIDSEAAAGTPRFEMDGYLYGLFGLR